MKYTDNEKKILGLLFKYYRTINEVKWSEIKKSNICSHTTYSKMENGIILRNDDFYTKFINFYQLNYQYISELKKWYQNYLPKVNHAFIWNEMDKFNELKIELDEHLYQYQDLIIYRQIYDSLNQLFGYYQDGIYMTKEEVEKGLLLVNMPIFDDDCRALLIELMFISCNNSIDDSTIFNRISEYFKENDHVLLLHVKGIYNKCNANFYSCLELNEKGYNSWKEINNVYQMVKCLNGMYIAYKNMDFSKAEEIAKLLLIYQENDLIPNRLKNSILYNLGMNEYLNKNYEKAYDLFLNCYLKFNNHSVLVLLGSICTHLNQELPDFFENINYYEYYYPEMLKYYYLKINKDNIAILSNYIINEIVNKRLLKIKYVYPFWSMFENEMLWLVSKNRKNMKQYLKFRKLMKETCIDG